MDARNSSTKCIEEPTMSDKTLVLNVEDFIALTFGPLETNCVNFSMMQTVLNILCRHMRFLDKTVEIRFQENEEHIQSVIQQLLEEESEDSSEFEEDRKKRKRYVEESKSDDALNSDDIEDFVEIKAKKSKDMANKSHLKDEVDNDLSTSTEAEDDQEIKGKKGKAKERAKTKTQKMDDDIDSKRSKDKSRKKDMSADDGKKVDKDERYRMTEESKGKGKKEKASKSATADNESPSSEDSGRSDDVSETYVKKGKDTLKMQLKTKKADDADTVSDTKKLEGRVDKKGIKEVKSKRSKSADADTVFDTKKTDGRVDKKGKKEVKSKRSESVDDVTPELGETEYSGKGKGKKRKDKKMAEMPEVQKARSKKGNAAADTHAKFGGISVTEVVRKGGKGPKDTILVVEKGPTTRDSYPHLGNIEVVTRSQFKLIESDVKTLMEQSGPMPFPFMPDTEQLKSDLVKGSATLPGAMDATRLNARVKAAEEALSRMAILLTQVASDGTLPPEAADMINQLQGEQRALSGLMSARGLSTKQKTSKAAIAPAETTQKTVTTDMYPPVMPRRPDSAKKLKGQHRQSTGSTAAPIDRSSLSPLVNPLLTQSDLSETLDNMKHDMIKRMTEITAKSTATAEQAHNIAKAAVDKLAISLALNTRIEILNKFTTGQEELLTGFDTGLSSELQGFQEKVDLMRTKLKDGLKHLDRGDRLESLAVTALKEYCKAIEFMVDETVHHHEKLVISHRQMYDEMRGVLDWVDLIRTGKAERADVAKGLKNKANINELQGLLFENAFEVNRKELNKQLDKCCNEFEMINSRWMEALAKLKAVSRKKANHMHLYSLRAFATDNLREFKAWLERLEDLLGDPQLALLTRLLSHGAYCGSCLVAAQMAPFDKNYKKPPPIPLFPVLGVLPNAEEPAVDILRAPDNR